MANSWLITFLQFIIGYQLIDYLVSFFSYILFKDEEDVKAIARLFADMGDSYVELIATGMILVYWSLY